MITKEHIKEDLRHSTDSLLDVLYDVPGEAFNITPVGGGWTIGEVAEHLIKVEVGTVRLFSGPVEATGRDPEQKIKKIKDRFLDFSTQMTAPRIIVPDDNSKDKTRVLEKLQDNRQRLLGFVDIQDFSELITGFAHPYFGPLTRVEWIYFHIYHSQRHIHQIKTIQSQL